MLGIELDSKNEEKNPRSTSKQIEPNQKKKKNPEVIFISLNKPTIFRLSHSKIVFLAFSGCKVTGNAIF